MPSLIVLVVFALNQQRRGTGIQHLHRRYSLNMIRNDHEMTIGLNLSGSISSRINWPCTVCVCVNDPYDHLPYKGVEG